VLDEHQSAVLTALAGRGHVVVTGAPGTGKTTLAVAAAAHAVQGGLSTERLLVLAPTRQSAATLRDRVSQAIGEPTSTPVARTAASAAFAILTAEAALSGKPRPSLVSGAEQDVVLGELLEGHATGLVPPLDWGGIPVEATRLAGFREELRNLLMRAAESGLSPQDLSDLGVRWNRVEWVAAGALYQEYEDNMFFRSLPSDQGWRYDPASMIAQAAGALQEWEDPGSAGPVWDFVIVDDYHDATAATHALVAAMVRRGSRLLCMGNADQSVQGYRGARPEGLADAAAGAFGPALHYELLTQHRSPASLQAVHAQIAARIGVKGVGSARSAFRNVLTDAAASDAAPVTILVAPHRYAQSRAIASQLRIARHGFAGPSVPWEQMCVIARSTSALRALRSDLLAADIPCETLGDGTALHREPAVAPLLIVLRVALGHDWSEDDALEVLGSRLVGLDPVALRRLRRALVREERSAGGARSSAELLVDALGDPARLASVPGPEAAAAARAARAVLAARSRGDAPGATPGAVMWAAWEALGVADSWREAALAGSARDDADLDAVIALMHAAKNFAERLPEARTEAFLDYLEGQDFAADSLGPRGQSAGAVSFCTPASAAGREWELVVIAGLEEGAWPNLRLRDSVLGAQRLSDVLKGIETDNRSARREVLDDETRALLVAASRARGALIVTAVDDGESRPGRFVSLIEDAAGVLRRDTVTLEASSDMVADLRAVVARLRTTGLDALTAPQRNDEALRAVAPALAQLAALEEPGASPATWHGVPPVSTAAGLWPSDVPVRVSPSKVDAVRRCGLRWAWESVGGTRESSEQQNVGSLIHQIAADFPDGTESEFHTALAERWHQIGARDTWLERENYAQAEQMLTRLARYLDTAKADRVLIEQTFTVEVGRAILSGQADRVEVSDGQARIVDLKTGARISAAQGADNGQLMMYQLAADQGGFDNVERSSGASLLFVGKGSARAGSVVAQEVLPGGYSEQVLSEVVEVMSHHEFTATPNDKCGGCPLRRACPAHAEGAQVTDQ
jgi:superfamily I DNA/RNA helicase/RecB family exonuclease